MSYLATLLYGYRQVNLSGSALAQRSILNFTGTGVTAVDNPATGATDVTITAGGSGSALTALTADVVAIGPGVASAEVQAIRGRTVASTAPSDGGILDYNGLTSTWNPVVVSQDGQLSRTGALTVVGIQTYPISTTAPTTGQVLGFNGTYWTPSADATSPAGTTTPEEHGAVRDGVTNDSAAFIAAAATGKTIICGNGTYLINTTGFTLATAYQQLKGNGTTLKTTSNIAICSFGAQGVGVSDVRFLGNSTGASQIAISDNVSTTGYERTFIRGCYIDGFGQAGIITYNFATALHQGTLIDSTVVINCPTYGIWLVGEYCSVVGCGVYQNGIGIRNQAGNNLVVGCKITDNTTGTQDVGGGNDGHGGYYGCDINHNTTNVHSFNSLGQGQPYVGCNIYGTGTSINLVSSIGMRFMHCAIDVDDYFFDGSTGTQFQGCLFPSAFTNTVHDNYNGHASTTRWDHDNRKKDGTWPTFITNDGTAWANSFSGSISLGLPSAVAGTGKIRLPKATVQVVALTNGGVNDMKILETDSSDNLFIGDAARTQAWRSASAASAALVVAGTVYALLDTTTWTIHTNGVDQWVVNSTSANLTPPLKMLNQSAPSTPTGGPYVYGSGGHLYSVNTDGDTFQLS